MNATFIQLGQILDPAHHPASYRNALTLQRNLIEQRIFIDPDEPQDAFGSVPYHPENIQIHLDQVVHMSMAQFMATSISVDQENDVRTGIEAGRAIYMAAIPYLDPLGIQRVRGLIDQNDISSRGGLSMSMNELSRLLAEDPSMSPEFTAVLPKKNPYGTDKLRIGICSCGPDDDSDTHYNILLEARYRSAPTRGLAALADQYSEALVTEEILAGRLHKPLLRMIGKTWNAGEYLEDFADLLTKEDYATAYADYRLMMKHTVGEHVRHVEAELRETGIRLESLIFYDASKNLNYKFPVQNAADIEAYVNDDQFEGMGMPWITAKMDGIPLTIRIDGTFYTELFGTHNAAMQITSDHPLSEIMASLTRSSTLS